jgi:hypothetical protein
MQVVDLARGVVRFSDPGGMVTDCYVRTMRVELLDA